MSRNTKSPVLWIATVWLLGSLAILLLSFSRGPWPDWIGAIYATMILLMSPVSIAFFWWDKRTARANADSDQQTSRIPEKTLHCLSLAGGWPGAVIGQQYFRHKSKKTSFRVVLALIAAIHVLAVTAYLWFWFTR
ncbi:MAG: DUF1294 domain-containing protein [Aureliella sp.]